MPKISKSNTADRRHTDKYILDFHSTTVCAICTKCCMKMHNPSALTVERQKFGV